VFNATGVVIEIAQALLGLAVAPLLVGLIGWVKARLQNRRGAPIWQAVRGAAQTARQGNGRVVQRVVDLPYRFPTSCSAARWSSRCWSRC